MPSNPKPLEQKRLLGNPGHQTLPKNTAPVQPLEIDPNDTAVNAYLTVMAHAKPWLGQTDAIAMVLLLEMLTERDELRAAVAAGNAKRHELRQLDTNLLALMRDLGLNPIARSKLGLAEVKAASNLEQMRQKRDNLIDV